MGGDCRNVVHQGGGGQGCVSGASEVGVGLREAPGVNIRVRLSSGPGSKLRSEGEG